MKKNILTLVALLFAFCVESVACTNFLITKGASADGSCMISYAADSHVLYGELYHYPAADYPEGAMREIWNWDSGKYLGQIPEVSHTYNVIGNMTATTTSSVQATFDLFFIPFFLLSDQFEVRRQSSGGQAEMTRRKKPDVLPVSLTMKVTETELPMSHSWTLNSSVSESVRSSA